MHASVLRYFDSVARLGSIRRAAGALNVASSAVNRQILKLEREVGADLFERLPDGVRLTSAGEVLLAHARGTLAGFERARHEIAGLSGRVVGHVRIILLESLTVRFMPAAAAELAAAHPDLSLTVAVAGPSAIAQELAAGHTDFGVLFVDGRLRRVEVVDRIATGIGAVMRPDHPLAARASLSLTECAGYPIVMMHDRWLIEPHMATEFARSGASIRPRIVSNSIELILQVIREGVGIGFFTPIAILDEIERGELVHVPLAEPALAKNEVGILVPRDRPLAAPARVVLEVVRRRLHALAGRLPAVPREA